MSVRYHLTIEQGHGQYKGGIPLIRDMTPEERYDRVLAWVRRQVEAPPSVDAVARTDGRVTG